MSQDSRRIFWFFSGWQPKTRKLTDLGSLSHLTCRQNSRCQMFTPSGLGGMFVQIFLSQNQTINSFCWSTDPSPSLRVALRSTNIKGNIVDVSLSLNLLKCHRFNRAKLTLRVQSETSKSSSPKPRPFEPDDLSPFCAFQPTYHQSQRQDRSLWSNSSILVCCVSTLPKGTWYQETDGAATQPQST